MARSSLTVDRRLPFPVIRHIGLPLADIGFGATAPTLTRLGNLVGYAFAINDDGYIEVDIPIDWAPGTGITMSFHCFNTEAYVTNSGEVRFQGTWSALPDDQTEPVDAATHTGTLDSGDIDLPDVAKELQHLELGIIAGGSLAVGDTIFILMKRINLLGGGNDPTSGKPVVCHAGYSYTSDKLGTPV